MMQPTCNSHATHYANTHAQLLRQLAGQAKIRLTIITTTKRFDAVRPPPVPAAIAAAVRAPYTLLRDLVVVEHPHSAVIDKLLVDMVRL